MEGRTCSNTAKSTVKQEHYNTCYTIQTLEQFDNMAHGSN